MAKCTNIQKSVDWCAGTPEYSGMQCEIYYISKSHIVKYPQYVRGANGAPTSSELEGDFTLEADATFKRIYVNPDKSQFQSDPQGETPSQTQLNKITAVHPGVGPEATDLALFLNNNDVLYIVRDMKGRARVFGNEKWPTKSTVTQDNGQGATGTAGTTIAVEVTDECAAPFFSGKFKTEDGEINAATWSKAA